MRCAKSTIKGMKVQSKSAGFKTWRTMVATKGSDSYVAGDRRVVDSTYELSRSRDSSSEGHDGGNCLPLSWC